MARRRAGRSEALRTLGDGAAGLAAVGIGGASAGILPAILGWGAAAFSALLVAGLVATGDMPPFTLYIAPLFFGIALLAGA